MNLLVVGVILTGMKPNYYYYFLNILYKLIGGK